MPVSPARSSAYKILRQLEASRVPVIDLLQAAEVSALKEVDRRLTTEIVMGVLRWRGELDKLIARSSKRKIEDLDPEVVTILRIALYQLEFLDRIPKHAIVDDAVEMTKEAKKRSASGFVNAVLRNSPLPDERWVGNDFESLSAGLRERVRHAFPEWLLKRWERLDPSTSQTGEDGALRLAYASLMAPTATLRVVKSSETVLELRRELEGEGIVVAPCLYAKERGLKILSGQVQNTQAYREARVVLQDEASQLVAELVAPERGQRILDLCAAPGMKSGQIAQALGAGSLIACDRSTARLRTMSKLVSKSVPDTVSLEIVRLDAALGLPFEQKFDRILLDAPCTGTGTLARNPDIKWRLALEDITRLAALQSAMLRVALPQLTETGMLVYATCSLEPEENSGVIEKVLKDVGGFRCLTQPELVERFPYLSPLFTPHGHLATRPDRHGMDGFNAAVIVQETFHA